MPLIQRTAASLDVWLWRHNRQPPAHPQTRQVELSGASIRMRHAGQPGSHPTLVMLCDPPNMTEHYDTTLSALEGITTTVVLELPGFGFSAVDAGSTLGFQQTVERVEEALMTLGSGPLVIYGPCICGFVACELVRRGRLPIQGLILAQVPDVAGMQAWCERMDPQYRLRRPGLGQLLGRFGASKLTRFWYRFATARKTDESLTATAQHLLRNGAGYPLATMLQSWSGALTDEALEIPALVLWGEDDRSHAATDRNSTTRHVPDAQCVSLDQCGHFPDLEQPERFAALVGQFISRLPDDATTVDAD